MDSADESYAPDDHPKHDLMGYPWPGSRLTFADFKRLCRVSNRLKRPINQIIREAVVKYTTTLIAKFDAEDKDD